MFPGTSCDLCKSQPAGSVVGPGVGACMQSCGAGLESMAASAVHSLQGLVRRLGLRCRVEGRKPREQYVRAA